MAGPPSKALAWLRRPYHPAVEGRGRLAVADDPASLGSKLDAAGLR